MALLNQKAFERKLQNMSSTQDSVQTVSLWMIHHKKHAEDMVSVWLEQLKKASKADRRLVLFYLANDVLQNSRKKGKEFSNAFTKILRDAMLFLSDKTIKNSVERVIKIWEERRLFESDYLEALRGKLDSGGVPVVSKKTKEKQPEKEKEKEKEKEIKPIKQKRLPPADFKPSKLIDALKALRDFEGELTLKESQLNSLRIDVSDLETVRQLKDRTGGGKFCEEYEVATTKLEEFSELLKREQQERTDLIKVLEDGEAFYDTSYGEVKVIVHAYKTFGNRLTSLKKKVDSKVNRLAQKAAEKAKTGPVSAPQASFLTSGLPDVAVESAPSTPSQTQPEADKSPEEDKAIDPTVDNIEVADMDIEDDSDSDKSETSEEASASDDPKGSNDQTPNSTESSGSQPTKSTPLELDNSSVIPPAVPTTPAQPLGPSVRPMMHVQGPLLPSRPPLVSPQPAVGMLIRPFIGVQRFPGPGPVPQFRPGVPQVQSTPGVAQNPLLQPAGTLSGHGQPFQQIPAGLLSNAGVPIPSGMGTIQPFQLGSGFVDSQAPLPVAATTVPAPVHMTPNSAPVSETSQGGESAPQSLVNVGSPSSEASAPSPVGSPELHLEEGDETPETTPAPLGDVDVNNKTGFETNQSFFDHSIQNQTKPGIGYGVSSAPKTITESPLSSSGMPSTSEQVHGQQQDAASAKKDGGQKVTAVDILAQLLSRGRKLQETSAQGPESSPTRDNLPSSTPATAPETPKENLRNPTSKPLLTLIDTLFPKLSDSIKTLKEKEKSVNVSETQCHPASMPVVNTPSTSLPARPLPCEKHTEYPNEEQGVIEYDSNHAEANEKSQCGPERPCLPSSVPSETPMRIPAEIYTEFRGDAECDTRHQREYHGNQPGPNAVTSLPSPRGHPGNQLSGLPFRGASPRFPHEMPLKREPDLVTHGPPSFEQRAPFQRPRDPPFKQFRSNTGPPFVEGPPIQLGPPHVQPPRGPPFERPPRDPTDVNEQASLYGQPQSHSVGVPPYERHPEGPTDQPGQKPDQALHADSPRGPPAMRDQVLPSRLAPAHLSSPRGFQGDKQPEIAPDLLRHGHSPGGSFKDGPVMRPSEISPVPPLDGLKKPLEVPGNEDRPSIMEQGSLVNEPPGIRRLPPEGPPQRSLEPRRAGPPPHRVSYPGVRDNEEQRRQFEYWEDSQREGYEEHARPPWDFPRDVPGPPPPHWRGPPVSPRGDPNRTDFLEDDPSMWTSFEGPGKSPGRFMDFPNRTREGFREGPPVFDRYHDQGPPVRRRQSLGDFEGGWVRHPGPLKRPGPPPIAFPGPSKRPYY